MVVKPMKGRERDMSPIAENVRTAAQWAEDLARQPIPSVIELRELAAKLRWIASSVEALEKKVRENEVQS